MNTTRLLSARALASLCLLAASCNGGSGRGDEVGECVAPLLPGDLVITEFMANPTGADTGKEWIEIYNPTDAEIDLSGVLLRFRRADGSSERIHQIQDVSIGAGEYLVLGDADPESLPAHVDYGYGEDLGQGLSGRDGELSVGCGTSAVDIVVYGFPGDDGAPENIARGFDGTREPDALGNDDLGAWCEAATVYEPGTEGSDGNPDAIGTPGERNDPCFSEQPTTCADNGVDREINPPTPGDLVITEYMPDPSAVGDDEGEWFEVYVGADVDLNGLAITKFGDEEPTDIIGSVDCIPVEAGTYLVFGHSLDTSINGGLPADFEFTLSMSNSSQDGTGISVGWGGQFLDTVTWNDSSAGASSQLDPMFLDPTRNDEEGAFCPSEDPYGDGDLGSPGEANPPCPIEAPEGSCVDADGALRDIVAPAVGDLWITEFMADPSAVGDTEGEWFEVYANAAFDLNALEFGRAEEVEEAVELDTCAPVEAGQYILFAKNAEAATNGGLPAVDYEVGLSLINSNGALFIATDGEVLDEVLWTDTEGGASRALDPSVSGPQANDDEANWCDGADPYGDGDLGTPAAENAACGGTPVGTCDDGGRVRDVVTPSMGDLVITEWMPDPSAVGDNEGEWYEVLVTADVDLNGMEWGDDPTDPDNTIAATGECRSVSAGTRIVLGRNADMMTNGGVDVFEEGTLSLSNGGDGLFVGFGGEVFDQITFTGSTAGSSTSVAPGSEDPASNDDEGNHCTSNTPFGDGDNGTPGAENACG